MLLRSLSVLIVLSIPALVLSQPRVCFFGDSITEGWMDAERHPAFAYPALIDSLLRADGQPASTTVTARGGETTEDALDRVDRDVLPVDPDVVVVAFGSNDYFIWGDRPASRVSPERFRYNCRILFEKCSGTGARVFVLAPPPVVEERFYRYFDSTLYARDGGVEKLRASYAGILEETASEFDRVSFVRFDTAFASDGGLMGFDGVHPLPEGHRRMAAVLLPFIRKALGEGRTRPEPLPRMQVYPSPFDRLRAGRVVIGFSTEEAGDFILRVIDSEGRQIRKIVYYAHTNGNHSIFWNARSDSGTMVASGAYTFFLQSVSKSFQSHSIPVF